MNRPWIFHTDKSINWFHILILIYLFRIIFLFLWFLFKSRFSYSLFSIYIFSVKVFFLNLSFILNKWLLSHFWTTIFRLYFLVWDLYYSFYQSFLVIYPPKFLSVDLFNLRYTLIWTVNWLLILHKLWLWMFMRLDMNMNVIMNDPMCRFVSIFGIRTSQNLLLYSNSHRQ